MGPKSSKYRYFSISSKFFPNKSYQTTEKLPLGNTMYTILLQKWKKWWFFAIHDLGRAVNGHILGPKSSKYRYFGVWSKFLPEKTYQTTRKLPFSNTTCMVLKQKWKKIMKYRYLGISSKFFPNKSYQTTKKLPLDNTICMQLLQKWKK